MKKLFPLILITALILFFIFKKFSPSLQQLALPTPTPALHPLAVSNLSSFIDPNTIITTEKILSRHSRYTSYLVSYYSQNLKLYALMNLPTDNPPPSGFPIIIVNHGYIPPSQFSTSRSYVNTSAYYASSGFLVLKPDFRGHANSQGEADRFLSRSNYAIDVLNLIAGLGTLPQSDIRNIFMYGHSMGAEVSLLVTQNSPQIKAISLWAPAVTDFPKNVTYFRNRRLPVPTDQPDFQSSLNQLLSQYPASDFASIDHLDKINIPLIIHHSPTDESVPYSWGQDLLQKLKDQNKSVTFYTYQNDDHNLSRHWSQALNRDLEFFRSRIDIQK